MGKHEGYHYGLDPGLQILRLAKAYGIGEITYYGFTTDNCKRPHEQIVAFAQACVDAVELIATEGVSLLVVGNDASPMFPAALKKYTTRTELNGGGIKVNFLVNYGWEWDLAGCSGVAGGRKKVTDALRSREISRMDLVIRWGGMRRLSGFLPVQSVYADFYIVDGLWPDFNERDFYSAMDWYTKQDDTLGG